MSHIKPQIPKELSEIVVNSDDKVKLENYFEDAAKYSSFDKYIKRYTFKNKKNDKISKDILEDSREQLINAGEMLWASKKYALLIVLQGMDTAGKDGIIKHVFSGLDPQGCTVASFKVPTTEEYEHDFLWRYNKQLPKRGEIVIFNRSHYEDVLVTMVHPECMETLPGKLALEENKNFWGDRYADINAFEKHLAGNGVLIIKFFLHISKDEQKSRLLERLSNEDKYWKISSGDLKEREYWDDYIDAYEKMLSNTSTQYAPWIIVPANDKKIARAIVAYSIAGAVGSLKIEYPTVDKEGMGYLRQAKRQLESE
jgi:PPK2 family polyphosphate:nucleotide phosphotransferase